MSSQKDIYIEQLQSDLKDKEQTIAKAITIIQNLRNDYEDLNLKHQQCLIEFQIKQPIKVIQSNQYARCQSPIKERISTQLCEGLDDNEKFHPQIFEVLYFVFQIKWKLQHQIDLLEDEKLMIKISYEKELEVLRSLAKSLVIPKELLDNEDEIPKTYVKSRSFSQKFPKERWSSQEIQTTLKNGDTKKKQSAIECIVLKENLLRQMERETELVQFLKLQSVNQKTFLEIFEQQGLNKFINSIEETWIKALEQVEDKINKKKLKFNEDFTLVKTLMDLCKSQKNQLRDYAQLVQQSLNELNKQQIIQENQSCENCLLLLELNGIQQKIIDSSQDIIIKLRAKIKENESQNNRFLSQMKEINENVNKSQHQESQINIFNRDKKSISINLKRDFEKAISKITNNMQTNLNRARILTDHRDNKIQSQSVSLLKEVLKDLENVSNQLEVYRQEKNKLQLKINLIETKNQELIKIFGQIAIDLLEQDQNKREDQTYETLTRRGLYCVLQDFIEARKAQIISLAEIFYEVSLYMRSSNTDDLQKKISTQIQKISQPPPLKMYS